MLIAAKKENEEFNQVREKIRLRYLPRMEEVVRTPGVKSSSNRQEVLQILEIILNEDDRFSTLYRIWRDAWLCIDDDEEYGKFVTAISYYVENVRNEVKRSVDKEIHEMTNLADARKRRRAFDMRKMLELK
jgi:hypothetical protein